MDFIWVLAPTLLREPVLSELLSDSVYWKLAGKGGGGLVNCCGWAEENLTGSEINGFKPFIISDTISFLLYHLGHWQTKGWNRYGFRWRLVQSISSNLHYIHS